MFSNSWLYVPISFNYFLFHDQVFLRKWVCEQWAFVHLRGGWGFIISTNQVQGHFRTITRSLFRDSFLWSSSRSFMCTAKLFQLSWVFLFLHCSKAVIENVIISRGSFRHFLLIRSQDLSFRATIEPVFQCGFEKKVLFTIILYSIFSTRVRRVSVLVVQQVLSGRYCLATVLCVKQVFQGCRQCVPIGV